MFKLLRKQSTRQRSRKVDEDGVPSSSVTADGTQEKENVQETIENGESQRRENLKDTSAKMRSRDGSLFSRRFSKLQWRGSKASSPPIGEDIPTEVVAEPVYEDDDRDLNEDFNAKRGGAIMNLHKVQKERINSRTRGDSIRSNSSTGEPVKGRLLSGASSRQSSLEAPIFQVPTDQEDELVYTKFLAHEENDVIIVDKNFPGTTEEYESINEPELALKFDPEGVHPSIREMAMQKKPLLSYEKARCIQVLAADDLFVEIIPDMVPIEILDSANVVVNAQYQEGSNSAATKASAQIEAEGYIIKTNGNLSKTFRVRLRGVMAPSRDSPYFEKSRKFVEKALKGRRIAVKIYGTDYFGRAISSVKLVKEDKDVNMALLLKGAAWHYAPLDTKKLPGAAAMEEAQQDKRGIWEEGTDVTPPWVSH